MFYQYLVILFLIISSSYELPIKNSKLNDLITDKLIQFGYLASSQKSNFNEIIKAIDVYKKFNNLNFDDDDTTTAAAAAAADTDDYLLIPETNLINLIYKKFKKSSEFILNKLLNHNLKRCSLPDFMRSNDNELNIKINFLNGNAYYYFSKPKTATNDAVRLLNAKNNKKKLTFTNIKDKFKNEFVKYQIISWWPKTKLTWSFINKPIGLTFVDTLYALNKAFTIWSVYSNLEFKFIDYYKKKKKEKKEDDDDDEVDLFIRFESSDKHDLSCKFKFANTTLAHAFYPTKGDAHFELGRSWSLENEEYNSSDVSQMKFNLISVATHEIGHLIGLGHSSNKDSVMYPDYKMEIQNFVFHKDDIEVLQYLYGKPKKIKNSKINNSK